VSAENVVATIEMPKSHQGNWRPDKKYSSSLADAFFLWAMPSAIKASKGIMMINPSIQCKLMGTSFFEEQYKNITFA
jgi:hypothetical protein